MLTLTALGRTDLMYATVTDDGYVQQNNSQYQSIMRILLWYSACRVRYGRIRQTPSLCTNILAVAKC